MLLLSRLTNLLVLSVGVWSPAFAKTSQLQEVRELIEKKETDQAVTKLRALYPKQLNVPQDVERVAQWMSIFLYDETVATFERAVQLAEEKDYVGASVEFKKALAKEPHNKRIHQAYIVNLIDGGQTQEALSQIEITTQQYPFFHIFSLYGKYLGKTAIPDKGDAKECRSPYLLKEEKEFCVAVQMKRAATQKENLRADMQTQAQKSFYPDTLFFLWEMTSRKEYLNKYIERCREESLKLKHAVRLYPEMCFRSQEVEKLLKPPSDAEE